MPGPYSIDSDINVGDPNHTEHHEALASAINESATAATPNVMILRDAAARAKVADPSVAADIANKGYVDTGLGGKANTSHTHTASQVTDFAEVTRDTMATALVAGANVTITPNDGADTITIAASGSGGGTLLAMVPKTGQYLYPPAANTWAASATAYASGNAPLVPIIVPTAITIDALATRIATAEPGIDVRLLLYGPDSDGHPSALVATGTATSGAAGSLVSTFTPVALAAGIYWGSIRSNGGTTLRFWGLASQSITGFGFVGASGDQRNPMPYGDVGTYASPANPLTIDSYTIASSNSVPYVLVRRL